MKQVVTLFAHTAMNYPRGNQNLWSPPKVGQPQKPVDPKPNLDLPQEFKQVARELSQLAIQLNVLANKVNNLCEVAPSFSEPQEGKKKPKNKRPLNHYRKWGKTQEDELVALIKEGHSRKEIAKILERTPRAVLCKQLGLAIVESKNQTKSSREICSTFGLEPEELEEALNKTPAIVPGPIRFVRSSKLLNEEEPSFPPPPVSEENGPEEEIVLCPTKHSPDVQPTEVSEEAC